MLKKYFVGGGAHLFDAGHLLPFSPFKVDAYLRWVPIQDWVLNQIKMVIKINT